MKKDNRIKPLDFCSSCYGEEDCIGYDWKTNTIDSDKYCRDCLHDKIKECVKALRKLRKIRDFEEINKYLKKII